MAKKGRREPDPDLEDEEVELDEPPRKKSSARMDKGKSSGPSAGKRKSTEGPSAKDSASRKSLKDSGKRKSTSSSSPASGRRPSSGDDEEMSGSARRRRAVPPKKKDSTAVIGVSILSITFILVIGIVVINKGRTPTENPNDEQAQLDDFKKMKDEGLRAFGEFNGAENRGEAGLSRTKHSEAHTKLVKAMDILTKILDNHRDPNTGYTHKDFEGYEAEQSEIAQILVDLEKRGDIKSSAGSGGGPTHDNSAPEDEDTGGGPDPIPSSGGANDAGGSRTRGG